MTVREQLRQLHKLGWDVRVLGATIFDSPNGITRLADHWEKIKKSRSKIVKVNDGPLQHNLVKTKSTVRAEMTATEEAVWYQAYTKFLDDFKPDVVYYYGGRTLDLLIGDEAHERGIPVAAYLANGNYRGKRWCKSVDLIITNSQATADLYREQDGLNSVTIGPFVDPTTVVAKNRAPTRVVAINPSLAKGAAIVAATAISLERSRPDIEFELIDSRGNWGSIINTVQEQLGMIRRPLENVVITPNQMDMRLVYARAKLLMVLSLWWESLPRVAIEALHNRIPFIGTDHGGLKEIATPGCKLIKFPAHFHKPPYNKLPSQDLTEEICDLIINYYDMDDIELENRMAISNKPAVLHPEYLAKKFNRKLIQLTNISDTSIPVTESGHTYLTKRLQQWLIKEEEMYGGVTHNVPREKVSPDDHRTAKQLKFGGMRGGDQMSDSQHGYAPVYAKYLTRYITRTSQDPTLMECGILTGIGLAIWCDLFPTGKILGLDVDLSHYYTNKSNLMKKGAFENNHAIVLEFDQLNPETEMIINTIADKKIDIVIDDGLHTERAIKTTLNALTPLLSKTCTIFIEDNSNASAYVTETLPDFQVTQYGKIAVATNF
jgi:glycosyltransferase involved in cell wall biosynthesis